MTHLQELHDRVEAPNFGHHGHASPQGFIDAWGDGPMVMRYEGRVWRFEFSEMFGPLLLTKSGAVAVNQPVKEKHPFWRPFNKWIAGGKRCHGIRSKRGKLLFYLCHVPKAALIDQAQENG